MEMEENRNPEDVIKILVATDIHLGFAEKEIERAEDSFNTFEEILCLGKEKDVDFILLGGDLFHDNKPSRYCLHRCIELIKTHTFGSKQIEFEVVNERDKSNAPFIPCKLNYEDPNLNVSYPIFSIHGNHDDPTGHDCLCSLDLLSAMGLVNHFGKCLNLNQVELKPLLFQKGLTKLALYGLGAIRDQRLHRIFREGKVSMIRPSMTPKDWCNILVVHQNRAKHSETGYLPEEYLEDFLDLVIWGHEHECRLTLEKSSIKDYYISQPGSSVATSLSIGESVPKQVGVLHIHKCDMWMEEIPLKTVRPFCIEDISIAETSLNLRDDPSLKVMQYCTEYVERMIEMSKEKFSGHPRQPKVPLIRLRVELNADDQAFSIVRFGQKFINQIANIKDIISFHHKREVKKERGLLSSENILKATENELKEFSAVELVRKHFENANETQRLKILTEVGLGKAVQEFVDKKETEAITEMIKHQKNKTVEYLVNKSVTDESIEEEIIRFKEQKSKQTDDDAEMKQVLEAAKEMRIEKGDVDSDEEMDVNDDNDVSFDKGDIRSGKRGAGRTRARGRGRGRGKNIQGSDANDSWISNSRASSNEKSKGRNSAKSDRMQLSIASMMQTKQPSTSRGKSIRSEVISESSEEEVQAHCTKKRKTESSSKMIGKPTYKYFDEDDDEIPNFLT